MSYIHYCCTKVRGPNPTVGSSGTFALAAATIASSGTSQQSAAISLATANETDAKKIVWQIKNAGDVTAGSNTSVYIVFGTNPTAVNNGAAMRALLKPGDPPLTVHAEVDGEKFAAPWRCWTA